jgi:hypothetical protein
MTSLALDGAGGCVDEVSVELKGVIWIVPKHIQNAIVVEEAARDDGW